MDKMFGQWVNVDLPTMVERQIVALMEGEKI